MCFLTGLDGRPLVLFVVPEFNFESLPANIYKDVFKVKKIILQHSFLTASKKSNSHNTPNWLSNFNEVEEITLRGAELDNLEILVNLPIKYLVFSDTTANDIVRVIKALKSFNELIEIRCDQNLFNGLKREIGHTDLKFNIELLKDD